MVLGKCPKCQSDYHLHRSANGVGGVYEVFIHKKANASGKMTIVERECCVSRPGEPAKLGLGEGVHEDG